MKTRNKQLHRKSEVINTSVNYLKIILFGAILLMAGICNSCNPDDDDSTDGTSGATSQLLIHHEFHSTISEQRILMS